MFSSHKAVVQPKARNSSLSNSRNSQCGLWEWQTWLVSFSSMDSSAGLLINRDFFFFFEMCFKCSKSLHFTRIEFDFCPTEWPQVCSNASLSKVETVLLAPMGRVRVDFVTGRIPAPSAYMCVCVCVWLLASLFRRSMSSWKLSKALSLEMIQLKEKVARFSSTSPFQNLEIIATLGVGGFGRVELVRGLRFKHLREAFWFFCLFCFISQLRLEQYLSYHWYLKEFWIWGSKRFPSICARN